MSLAYFPWTKDEHTRQTACLFDTTSELTYGELDSRVAEFASTLTGEGIGAGNVVAIMLPNRNELAVALFAGWRVGATMTLVNPAFTDTEAQHQLNDSQATLLINAGTPSPVPGLRTISVGFAATEAGNQGAAVDPVVPDLEDTALLVYTSGSTGLPKGVMLSHGNLLAMAEQMVEHMKLTSEDRCLLFLPLFHVNALLASLLSPLYVGAQVYIMPKFDPLQLLQTVEERRITYFSAVPTIFALLTTLPDSVRIDTSSLRFAVCGAAPTSAELLSRVEARFGLTLIEGYGLTEATCCTTCNPLDGVKKLGTVGPAVTGQKVAIMGPGDNFLPAGEVGEVVISGPVVMKGYLGKPEETARAIRNGWLHTGDIGRLDEDGYLTLVDRLKDMIIRGGENIYPKEVESFLAQLDGVLESAVVGKTDPVMGEVPVAFVSLYPGSQLSSTELDAHCRFGLTRFKVPVEFHVVDAIPKNPVGKIDKPAIRRLLRATHS